MSGGVRAAEPSTRRLAVDPHVHTAASHDCSTPLDDVLAAAAERNLDAIAVTDHDAIEGALRAVERAPAYGLTAIPGVEVSTADGHLLALFVTERPPAGEPLEETVAWIREHDGVAIVPHPFQVSRHGVRKRRLAECDVDGLETFNAWAMTGVQNRRAHRFATRRGCGRIGASDAHSAGMVGRAYTVLEPPACEWTKQKSDAPVPKGVVRRAFLAGRTAPAGEGATLGQYVGKIATQLGSRTAGMGPRRLFASDRS